MNRAFTQIAVAGLCLALIPSPHAFAKQKKKKVDLSANPLANVNSKQPDKELFDKALLALKKGRYDVARLDLQTLLNTYPETEYAMRAKLAIGDTWYKEGGSAALTQAESEYKDFITFFPNTPEAAEAQMKVGDIYFQQMAKPDRDSANAVRSEEEYRTMLQDFPDSPLIPRAKQRLREVQEVLAQRQYEIGEFYAGRENWAGAIARLQTVADSYPLFSHCDQTLITLGDAYATEAQIFNNVKQLTPQARAELVKVYNDRAAAAWDRVVLRYPMAPHVEDAKDRLIALGRDIPEPTQQELAESEAEEGSRINVKLKNRVLLLIKQGPSTIQAARVGEPTLSDPPATLAPDIERQGTATYNAAVHGKPLPGVSNGADATAVAISNGTAPPTPAPAVSAAPLQLQTIPDQGGSPGSTVTVEVPGGGGGSAESSTAAGSNTSTAAGSNAGGTAAAPADGRTAAPSINPPTGNTTSVPGPDPKEPVVKTVGPVANNPLPPVDKPAEAANQINDVKSGGAHPNASATGGKKHKKAPYNKNEESSSKHKKKKGLDKINPF